MRYKSFRIQNFKGIKDTTVNLYSVGGAAIFAMVGLNESGKTTVLEAIHSFSPDAATSELLGGEEGTGVPIKDRVPRHLLSSFTGDVSVTATLLLTDTDKEGVYRRLDRISNIKIDLNSLPSEVIFEKYQRFKDGDFVNNFFSLRTPVLIKTGKQRSWRTPNNTDEIIAVRNAIYAFTPDIAYFPTFVFDFPDVIFLTNRGGVVDKFYRRSFQDILDFEGRGYTIEKDIVRRIRDKTMIVPWLSFVSQWYQHDDREKIQHVMDRASATVTRMVFGRWNKIFGEDTRGKEITISFDMAEGEVEDDNGHTTKTEEHDIYIKFQIRDGTRRFNVNDRSLGFRWFFAFMLFTQFRVARSSTRPLLFLFDEPASNLHAAAQQKLIDCFPEIAQGEHMLAYTTHSHYMIEPKWLEQTFIVTNRADAPLGSVLDEASLDDESLDIQVSLYRTFVNAHPNQTSYFQPILDRLNVVPSRFDILKPSIIIEGKSDYYIIRYAAKAASRADVPLIPGMGAGTLGALVALHVGWGVNFCFLLDGDGQGKKERDRYIEEFVIPVERIKTLDELVPGLKEIENLLDEESLGVIASELRLSGSPSKNQIRRFFQERLASDNITGLSPSFIAKANSLLDALKALLPD